MNTVEFVEVNTQQGVIYKEVTILGAQDGALLLLGHECVLCYYYYLVQCCFLTRGLLLRHLSLKGSV